MSAKAERKEDQKPVEPISTEQWQGWINQTHFLSHDKKSISCRPTVSWDVHTDQLDLVGRILIDPKGKSPFSIEDPNTGFEWSLARQIHEHVYFGDEERLKKAMQERSWQEPEQFEGVLEAIRPIVGEDTPNEEVNNVFQQLSEKSGLEDDRVNDRLRCDSWKHDHWK